MSLFTPETHNANSPDTWTVRKSGRRFGVFSMNSENPLNSFTTKREADEATKTGPLVDLYEKERRWYAGEQVSGWKPFSTSTTSEPKQKPKPTTLATSGSLNGIQKCINEWWYSTSYTVNAETMAIENTTREVPKGYTVSKVRSRYHFVFSGND